MAYQNDSAEILAIAQNLSSRIDGVMDLAHRHIAAGSRVEDFRAAALDRLPNVRPVANVSLADVKARDWQRYSLSRAILNNAKDGFEAEMSQEIARQSGRAAQGFFVPNEAFATRSLVAGTATLGGNLVETSLAASQFIEALRNKSQILALGAKTLQLNNTTVIPRQNSAGAVSWVGETASPSLTNVGFDQVTLTPKVVSTMHQYSKMLLVESNPSVDSIVRNDILATIGIEIDRAALHGAGSGGVPQGICGTTGVGSVVLATNGLGLSSAGSTCHAALTSLESVVSAANADSATMGYLLRPAHRGALRTVQRFTSTDTPVYQTTTTPDGTVEGRIGGYRALVTNQLATNLTVGTATTITSPIVFGDFSNVMIGEFGGGVDIITDPYTLGANGVVRLYARKMCDIAIRQPSGLAVLYGIL